MANKLQNINDLAMETTLQITNSPDDWMNFLNTAANNYKYSFNDQVLIFSQKPEATACADMNTWNTRLHRWIKKGSRGIALVQNNGYGNSLRHVFDISDTYDNFGRQVPIWSINHNFDNEIIESLENKFGDLEAKDNLQLNLFTDNKSEDEQIQIIENAEVLENDTPAFFVPENGEIDNSNFEFTEEMITSALKEGRHFKEGKFRIEKQFKESFVTKAIRDGGAVVFEEINFAKPAYLAFLNSLLDDNGFVRLDNGEVVRRNPNFRFFATMNLGYFGTKELNHVK